MNKYNPNIKINHNCFAESIGENDELYQLEARIQNGPIKEVGRNGCQIDDVITFCFTFISRMDEKFSCTENMIVKDLLLNAIRVLALRKKDRETRDVEGEDKL